MAVRFVSVDHDTPMLLPPDLRDWVPAVLEDQIAELLAKAEDADSAHLHRGGERVVWVAQANRRASLRHHQGSARVPPLSSPGAFQGEPGMDPRAARLQHQAALSHRPGGEIAAAGGGARFRARPHGGLGAPGRRSGAQSRSKSENAGSNSFRCSRDVPEKQCGTGSPQNETKRTFGSVEATGPEPTTGAGASSEGTRILTSQQNSKVRQAASLPLH